jgi:hypothetical protein
VVEERGEGVAKGNKKRKKRGAEVRGYKKRKKRGARVLFYRHVAING